MYIAPATISARSHKIVQSQYEITMPWVILHYGNNGKMTFCLSYSSYVGHARRQNDNNIRPIRDHILALRVYVRQSQQP